MSKKPLDIKGLRRLLEKCLNSQLNLAFFLPHSADRNPTWNELTSYATEVYAMALSDVLDAMEGDTSAIEEVLSEEGRICFKFEDKELLMERLEEFEKSEASRSEPHD
ncbi:MAG: hypothetical protein HY912_09010 [Desulfomonile tiedjei]|uniref:Uncharacterized protein n=1 Tax=Desulfomonile tiedjei TaxID=2358 RepID=A0A9D6V043_9BACT|nr:hypothetical protein [Desulfomonile tiedjei]